MKNVMIIIIFISISIISLSSCLGNRDDKGNIEINDKEDIEINDKVENSSPPIIIKEFTIVESNYQISPNNITVNKGDNVKIVIFNNGGIHNLFIEGYDIKINTVSAGNSKIIKFIANKSGIFKMWCEVNNHRNMGMEGQLIVKE